MRKILYIHGMGGGSDSRIPSILSECLCSTHPNEVAVTVRTYDFDPEIAHEQITSWVDEIKPDMVIGSPSVPCTPCALRVCLRYLFRLP